MKEEALEMILGMLAVGVLITAISGKVLPLVIVAMVAWSVWCVAKGLDS